MNCTPLILAWLLSALPADVAGVFSPSHSAFSAALGTDEPIVRGQSPTFGQPGGTFGQPAPAYGQPMPAYGQPMPGYAPAQGGYPGGVPFSNDPFLQQNPYSPVYPSPQATPTYTFGANGPAPVQYGMTERIDFTYMPSEGTSNPNVGSFEVFAIDIEKEFSKPLSGNWTLGLIPHVGIRAWDGPTAGGTSSLPGSVYSFGLGMRLASPQYGRWSFEFGFDPTVATDFKSTISSDGLLLDGHAVAFYRASPQFLVALGIAYWDRVDDIILPYAGVVYTPNDLWEFRLLFPKPRISYFLGTPNGVATWAYVGAEYHVEAYQVDAFPGANEDRVQIEDWRVVAGMRFEAGWLTSFIEAGYVFDRRVEFDNVGTDFDIDSGFITRAGFRF